VLEYCHKTNEWKYNFLESLANSCAYHHRMSQLWIITSKVNMLNPASLIVKFLSNYSASNFQRDLETFYTCITSYNLSKQVTSG
jgi:hypothetical protein